MGFGNAIEGEKSAQRLAELVWWVSAVASATIETTMEEAQVREDDVGGRH